MRAHLDKFLWVQSIVVFGGGNSDWRVEMQWLYRQIEVIYHHL
jgi:hypothetical protein